MRKIWFIGLVFGGFPLQIWAKNVPHCHGQGSVGFYREAQGIESFVIMVPESRSPASICGQQKALHEGVLQFYVWYLQNQKMIERGLSQHAHATDLFPPFNVSYQDLTDYFNFIQRKFPKWIGQAKECLSQGKPSSTEKSSANEAPCVSNMDGYHSDYTALLSVGH